MPTLRPTIRFHRGLALVDGWPARLATPSGAHRDGARLRAPARLRHRLRHALALAGVPYRDETNAASPAAAAAGGSAHATPPGLAQALRTSRHRGILIGQSETTCAAVARLLTQLTSAPPLTVTPDTATAHRWQARPDLPDQAELASATILTIQRAARDMHWLGGRHDTVLVDGPERMPATLLDPALDQCAALARIGFAGSMPARDAERWCTRIGPVLAVAAPPSMPHGASLLVPLPPEAERHYHEAWSTFLGAFDRFVAARGDAGFGTFLAQARKDPLQRPAVHAWHEAIRCAAWHEHKALVVDDLLHRHADRRVLLFTPDRNSAYELSRRHLIPALTSELPLRERAALLDAYADGTVRALAGPKLLDSGVAERSADVGILVGGGFGPAQRASRCRRVRADGIVFELLSQDTLEVGRAHRWHHAAAGTAAVVHQR
ncbi:MAG: hypothetical protein ACE37K_11915 [Planctomycetota bacterium]